MAEGVISNLVANALESLGKSAFKEASSWWGARDDLKKLGKSMEMIQARVHEAEKYQEEEGSDAVKLWLRRLKLVLYQADDLFDHILTVDSQKQRRKQNNETHLCSLRSSRPVLNWKIVREIKSIREQLDAIKSDVAGLNLSSYAQHRVNPSPQMALLMNNRETSSFVEAEDVIGRENDREMIIQMLLHPKFDGEKVTVIPIVGFGGLGKTTLAQFVFNAERVQNHFDLTRWAYVPDKNDRSAVMRKLFICFTGKNCGDLPLEELQRGIRESIESKKYLLVLDDIWDESVHRLHDLVNLLKCGKLGSKVIITTRSDVVAKGLGTIEEPYILGTLTDDQSWNLFERLALKPQQGSNFSSLSEIGKDIVKMCGNVPLAIKVAAGFLCSRDTPEDWLYVRDAQRAKAQHTIGSDIMPILKLSYDDLPPALKQCFAYCSLFKKGYKFSQTELVHLWMAQGYFEASSRDIGDRYFLELLRRNLFQDPEEDLEANITSCKMHDLVHDLAQHVAGHESLVLGESSSSQITDALVHVNLGESEAPTLLFEARILRSLSLFVTSAAECDRLISRFKSLRVLSLGYSRIKKVPDSIGTSRHLRYINLRDTGISCLPRAIIRLENLQTLDFRNCYNLEELPIDFTELPNLKHLAIAGSSLTALPLGIGKMTSLQELDEFIVGESNGIDSVPALNLMRNLHIKFCKWRNDAILEAQRANLKDSQRLSNLTLDWELEGEEVPPSSSGMNEMLTYLQLPPNLKKLVVYKYSEDEMPCRWLNGLSKLVSITISDCDNCRVLPHMSQLPHLKNLYLKRLDALEYVEDEDDIWVGGDCGYAAHYFPALEDLELDGLPRLKEWTRPSKSGGQRQQQQRQLLFPRLLKMEVQDCEEFVSMPLAPKLESLKVFGGNAKLMLHDEITCKWLVGLSKLVSVTVSGCGNCRVLPHVSHLPHLKYLKLRNLAALEYVDDEEENWFGGNCDCAAYYFPTLEVLELDRLPLLKEWTRPSESGGGGQQQRQPLLFARLLQMKVEDCKELVSMPLAPKLESLEVRRGNGKLFKSNVESLDDQEASSTLYTSLKRLEIHETKNGLVCLSVSSKLCELETLIIIHCSQLRRLTIESSNSIQYIEIIECGSWSNILKGDFPLLVTLKIWWCSEVFEEGEERLTTGYWQGLRSLRRLELGRMNNLKKLPPGIACLTNLKCLQIGGLENLVALPEEICNLFLLSELRIIGCPKLALLPLSLQGLTSLQKVHIRGCPDLQKRYKTPNGQDCHLLQHIPHLEW